MSQSNQVAGPDLNPARQEQAREYARLRWRLLLAELVLGVGWLLLLVASGLSAKLSGWLALPTLPAAALYFVFLVVTGEVLTAPLSYYRGFVLPHRYRLSVQRLSDWLGDKAKAGLLSLLLAAGFVVVTYWFMISRPLLWWLLAWGVAASLSLLLTNLAPLVVVPIFFKTEPLNDVDLKPKLEQLTERAQTRVHGIYTIVFSNRGTMANAALIGLGNTRRIVLSDTLLRQYSPSEIEAVVAHELGHNQHHDTTRLFVVQSAIWLVGFYLVDLVLRAGVLPLGFAGISDVAALPLLMLIFVVFGLLVIPLTNTYSRRLETAADEFALRLTGDPESFISTMTKLAEQNLAEAQPGRWTELLACDHPSYRRRVEQARHYL